MLQLLAPVAIMAAQTLLPSLVGRVAGDASGRVAESVVGAVLDVAKVHLPDRDDLGVIKQAIAAVSSSPELQSQAVQRLAEIEARERQLELEAIIAQVKESGATARAELATGDRFIQRARPTAIYALTAVLSLIVVVVLGLAVFQPGSLAVLRPMMEILEFPLLGLAAVAGVYAWRRTDDKKIGRAGGEAPADRPGIW